MSKQSQHYLDAAASLSGDAKVRALRAAQNHLQPTDAGYTSDLKRIQTMIVEALEGGAV